LHFTALILRRAAQLSPLTDDPAQLQLATSFYAIKKHHSCQKLQVYPSDLAGNGRWGNDLKNQREGIPPAEPIVNSGISDWLSTPTSPGTEGAEAIPAVTTLFTSTA
jgi:hypothetical protein